MPEQVRCPACGQPTTFVRRPLTRRQRELVDFIATYEGERHIFPTFVELAKAFQFRSLATVHEHITNLVHKGWIVRVGTRYSRRPFATTASAWGEL